MTQPPQGPNPYAYPYPPPGHPMYAPAGPPQQKPPSNFGWAVAALLLFWPLCIPSFIYASRVDGAWAMGDPAGAQSASQSARTYGLIGVIIGAVLTALAIIGFVLMLLVFTNSGNNFSVP